MTKQTSLPPHLTYSSTGQTLSGSLLVIDTKALAANYNYMAEKSQTAECAGVIKADAYGTGLEEAAKTLWQAGCRTFFIALPREGERARAVLPEANLYTLNGLVGDDSAQCLDFYAKNKLRPVLGSLDEIAIWQNYCAEKGEALPCALHFDTGMNRLGLTLQEAEKIGEQRKAGALSFEPSLLISHLVAADEPDHPLNREQLERFKKAIALFPGIPASLANSGGIMLGPDFHFDLMRPGIALYGGRIIGNEPSPMKIVATLKTRILSTRCVKKGQSVSYGATRTMQQDSRTATLCIGYADGYLRASGSSDAHNGACVWIEGHKAPILGRVTMDLLIIDVTDIPENLAKRGALVEMFGPHIPIDEVAEAAGTISYELLTSLGTRATRLYE